MTIATEITRIKTNIENAYTALEEKGATMPEVMNSNNLAETVSNISSTSTSIMRGSWNVPQIYIDVDNATNEEDDLYQEASSYLSGNIAVIGILLHPGVWKLKVDFYYGYSGIYAIKTSDGQVYKCKEVTSNSERIIEFIINNVNNNAFFILYSNTNGYFIRNMQSTGVIAVESLVSISETTINRSTQYYAFKNMIPPHIPTGSYVSFNVLNNIPDEFKVSNIQGFLVSGDSAYSDSIAIPAEYIPPVNTWSKTNIITFSSNSIFKNHRLHCIPDGLDLSGYTGDNTLKIFLGGGSDYVRKNGTDLGISAYSLRRAYVKLGPFNTCLCNGVVLTKENWEYIADNAPVVENKTLEMGDSNMFICGGENSEIITTLTNKGWTVS